MLKKFFTQRSLQEKLFFCVTIFVLILLMIDRFIYDPVISKMDSLNVEIQKQEKLISRDLRLIGQRDKIKREENKYNNFISIQSRQFNKEDVATILNDIEIMAKKII